MFTITYRVIHQNIGLVQLGGQSLNALCGTDVSQESADFTQRRGSVNLVYCRSQFFPIATGNRDLSPFPCQRTGDGKTNASLP